MSKFLDKYWPFLLVFAAFSVFMSGAWSYQIGVGHGYAQRVFYEVQQCIVSGYLCPSGASHGLAK